MPSDPMLSVPRSGSPSSPREEGRVSTAGMLFAAPASPARDDAGVAKA
jgi:hypothetical protein